MHQTYEALPTLEGENAYDYRSNLFDGMALMISSLIEKCDPFDTAVSFLAINGLSQYLAQGSEFAVLFAIPQVIDTAHLVINVKDVYSYGYRWLSTFNFFTLGNLTVRIALAVGRLCIFLNFINLNFN